MIRELIPLPKYDWYIRLFISNKDFQYDVVEAAVIKLGIVQKSLKEIQKILTNGKTNLGFTFTKKNYSVVFIGEQDCALEFAKTFDHEKGHVASHIAEEYNIDPYSEEFQYLNQYVTEKLFKIALPFM